MSQLRIHFFLHFQTLCECIECEGRMPQPPMMHEATLHCRAKKTFRNKHAAFVFSLRSRILEFTLFWFYLMLSLIYFLYSYFCWSLFFALPCDDVKAKAKTTMFARKDVSVEFWPQKARCAGLFQPWNLIFAEWRITTRTSIEGCWKMLAEFFRYTVQRMQLQLQDSSDPTCVVDGNPWTDILRRCLKGNQWRQVNMPRYPMFPKFFC